MSRFRVSAPARLHFGLLDAKPGKGVRFGSLGLAVEEPRLVLEAEPAGRLEVEGPQAGRVRAAAASFIDAAGILGGARIRVRETIPDHVGLGSGTQVALATALAIARLHGLQEDLVGWCRMLGRGRRSGIGTHAFRLGGFLLDAGHAEDRLSLPPLVFRQPFPGEWRIVAVIAREGRGVSGEEEERLFAAQPDSPISLLDRLSGIILMQLLPALLERDLPAFGLALEKIQEGVGSLYQEAQGGLYHPVACPWVRWLREAGCSGVGQSSWGPCVYAFTPDHGSAYELAARARREGPEPGADVRVLQARNHGAEVDETT
ncbi:MAG: beta-ribofuranosylaminobenzene 5'-phosphate synthase family protein [Acidobacteriota bacterium]